MQDYSPPVSDGLVTCFQQRGKWRGEIYIGVVSVPFVLIGESLSLENTETNAFRRAGPVSLSTRCPEADLEGFHSPANSAWILIVSLFASTPLSFVCIAGW